MPKKICFIVNPQSRGGKTGKEWNNKFNIISSELEDEFDLRYTLANGIGEGVKATQLAIDEGVDLLISVGGEGTAHEVLNGIMSSKQVIKFGFIRSGTMNDYLRAIDWPSTLLEEIDVIRRQEYVKTPVVKATGTTTKYGLNVADIGVGAKIAYMASVERKLTWIRHFLRYQILSIRAVLGWKNIESSILIDDQEYSGQLSLLTSGFSPFSGGYHLHPHASVHGTEMAFTMAMNFSRLDMIKKMKMLEKGQHTNEMENIYMGHAKIIQIETKEPTIFEVDGEPFPDLSKKITIESVPNAIDILKK